MPQRPAGADYVVTVSDAVPADGFRGDDVEVISDQITIGGSGVQFVTIHAAVALEAQSAVSTYCALPACDLFVSVYVDGGFVGDMATRFTSNFDGDSVSVPVAARLGSGVHTVSVRVGAKGVQPASPVIAGRVLLTMMSAPFGSTGTASF